MKLHVQKLPLAESTSFVARTYRTPNFEVGWHLHEELELILFTEGSGLSFIGNHVGEFQIGDLYLLGSNLPHTFQKQHPDLITSAIVVQFREDFWGSDFLNLPESKSIRTLFSASLNGLRISGATKTKLKQLIQELENADGFNRLMLLLECLRVIAIGGEYQPVSTQLIKSYSDKDKGLIEGIYKYTLDHFRERITLDMVADIANMSVATFCNYFKRSTKKTYIDFLNEIRIGHACILLAETSKSILEICLESGFNTETNFHRRFFRNKGITPLQYRKRLLLSS